jgi:hypothetical protein
MHDGDTALLVRGRDRFGHFTDDVLPEHDLEPAALDRQRAHQARITSDCAGVKSS